MAFVCVGNTVVEVLRSYDLSREFKNRCWTLFAILACGQSSALAQTAVSAPPNPADELRRQQERLQIESQQQQRVPDVHLTTAESSLPSIAQRIPETEVPCFSIERLELRGQDAGRFAWLKDVVSGENGGDSPLGRCLGAGGINVVLKRAQDALVAKGFVTSRVLAEPQDVSKGELILSVLPGRLRDSRLAASENSRGTVWNAMPAGRGDVLNIRDIEQALENFRRIPSVEADIQIEPGAAPGESDLVILYKQRTPYRVNVFVDDSGSKGTGKYQSGVTLSYDNCLALNDLCYVTLNHDLGGGDAGRRGTRGNTAHYSLPFGYWMLGTTVSNNNYFQTVVGANQDYVYSGTSQTAEIKLARLIYRDASRKTTVNVKAFKRKSNNFIDDTEVEVQRRAVGGWEIGFNHKEFIGPAIVTNLHLGY